MIPLITPQEVVNLAFNSVEQVDTGLVRESTIIAAQQKFILPALGQTLYTKVEQGAYQGLCMDKIKMPLALYVRMLCVPVLVAQMGVTGIMQHRGANFSTANTSQVNALMRALRVEADTLMQQILEYVGEHTDAFPDYNAHESVFNKVVILGNLIIT